MNCSSCGATLQQMSQGGLSCPNFCAWKNRGKTYEIPSEECVKCKSQGVHALVFGQHLCNHCHRKAVDNFLAKE